jgi:hypothetical protein
MMTKFEGEYLDVLQNIEAAIVSVYRQNHSLTDYDVDKVLKVLIKAYQSEQQGYPYQKPLLLPLAEQVYTGIRGMCEWRLGREIFESENHRSELPVPEALMVGEILACLKRIRKSVEKWNKWGGTRGYLQYIDQFFG